MESMMNFLTPLQMGTDDPFEMEDVLEIMVEQAKQSDNMYFTYGVDEDDLNNAVAHY